MAIQQLQPATNFPISRLLPDLGDGLTYFLQAVIRNATTGATIATINLTSIGNRLYTNTWRVAADSSGRGLYVTITTSVYTDSGRTALAIDYSQDSDTYIVYDQFHQLQGLATQLSALMGEATHVDYKKIKQIAEAAVKRIVFPKDVDIDYAPAIKQVGEDLKRAIAEKEVTKIPEYKETDLSPILEAIKGTEDRIAARIKEPEMPEKIDLSPILDKLAAITFDRLIEHLDKISDEMSKIPTETTDPAPAIVDYMRPILEKMQAYIAAAETKEKKAKELTPLAVSRAGDVRKSIKSDYQDELIPPRVQRNGITRDE